MRGEREGRKGVSGLGRGVAGVLRLCAGSPEIAKAPQNAGETKPLREASVRDGVRGGAGDGGSRGIRTHDPVIKSHLLYQLSYTPGAKKLERAKGFGPSTSTLAR